MEKALERLAGELKKVRQERHTLQCLRALELITTVVSPISQVANVVQLMLEPSLLVWEKSHATIATGIINANLG